MVVETVKMSSRGQIVIPQGIRQDVHAEEGTVFAVVSNKDTVILKKITTPTKEQLIHDLRSIAKKSKKKLQARGITEEDLRRK
jgi:AbrB family looped-hinge helix DNA binding protein